MNPISIRWRVAAMACAMLAHLPLANADAGHTQVLNPKSLPLGDGKVSTAPKAGFVYACSSHFRGGGAQHDGDWIQGATWDATRKIWVQGEVLWPNAKFTLETTGQGRMLRSNGLPVGHATGTFPIARNDPAYQIDRNPNAIAEQMLTFTLPLQPAVAASGSCLSMGIIGVALNGVPIFNALDDAGRDAVAHEVQDKCNGHPQGQGVYHYHGPSGCIPGGENNNSLLGYALDGFGIYSGYDENGREITNAELDSCHGRTSPVLWDGKLTSIYHYVMTREYPYTLGCYRGTPVQARLQNSPRGNSPRGDPGAGPDTQRPDARGPDARGPQPGRRAPPEALAACSGKAANANCSFTSPRGDAVSGQCRTLGDGGGEAACVPRR
jgi:hypothetical protein